MYLRIANYLIGGLILAVLVLFVWTKFQGSRIDAHKSDAQLYSGNALAHETAVREFRTITVEKEKAHADLQRAVEANPAWADEPLPSDIADLMRNDSGTARSVP